VELLVGGVELEQVQRLELVLGQLVAELVKLLSAIEPIKLPMRIACEGICSVKEIN
jgi:hypothetical protein